MTEEPNALLPARMLNEFAYCPRLFHLEYVDREWADNAFTADGKRVHARVDRVDQVLPAVLADEPGSSDSSPSDPTDADPGEPPPQVARSVTLGSQSLGLIAKMDLVAVDGNEAVPVDTKRGKAPDIPEGAWEPERVQLMAQGLLLREHGYTCERGILYFAGSRRRVTIPFTPELETRTRDLAERARADARQNRLPLPLDDSPKCKSCSLAPICLPDETLVLQAAPRDPSAPASRRLYPTREDALPFYVVEQGAKIGKRGKTLVVQKSGEKLATVRLRDVSQVVLCGNVQISTQTIHLLCECDIPVIYQSTGSWFYGMSLGIGLRNSYAREAQFRAARDPDRALTFARAVVRAKAANQRTLLRRNGGSQVSQPLREMKRLTKRIDGVPDSESLLGVEGAIAAIYFQHFGEMLRQPDFVDAWDFKGRNRRPPCDPINAMLSYGYALLAKDCTTALLAAGLDPWWGLFHRARHGRPSLALDLMEEFRALIVDSAVLTAVNTGMVQPRNFKTGANGCLMHPAGKRAFIKAYELRMDQMVTHPIFGYRCAWRSIIKMQARFVARWLRGDITGYQGITTR